MSRTRRRPGRGRAWDSAREDREPGRYFEALFRSLDIGVCFFDASLILVAVNPAMLSESLMEIAAKIGEKDQDMALRCVTEAIAAKGEALGRDDLWMFNNRGILLRRQGLWKQAVENYEKALAVAPDDAGLLYNLGVAHDHRRQLPQRFRAARGAARRPAGRRGGHPRNRPLGIQLLRRVHGCPGPSGQAR